MTTLRFVALALFTIGMMFALHPLPREPWGVLGMGDLFAGYVGAFLGATIYVGATLRRPHRVRRPTLVALRHEPRSVRKAA